MTVFFLALLPTDIFLIGIVLMLREIAVAIRDHK